MAKYTIMCEDLLTGEYFEILEVECENYNRWAFGQTVRCLLDQLIIFDTRRSIARVYKRSFAELTSQRRPNPMMIVECVCYAEATRDYAQVIVNGDIVRIIKDVQICRHRAY